MRNQRKIKVKDKTASSEYRASVSENKRKLANLKGIENIDQIISVVLIIGLAILPLLVRVKIILFTSPKILDELVNSGMKVDIFSYYKYVFLIILTFIVVGLLIWKMIVYGYELRRSYINLPILLLAFLTILSGISSEYLSVSLTGMYNRHEGTLTYLCYLGLFFVAANTKFKKWFGRFLFISLYIVVSINVIIILFDFYGKDLLNNYVFRALIVPSYLLQSGLQGNLNSTLSNPNYVSGLSASLVCFFLTAAMLEKSRTRRIVYSIFSVLSFAMMIASLSTSGFLTLTIILPVIVILAIWGRAGLESFITGGATLLICASLLLVLNAHNPKVWDESVGSFKGITNDIRKVISFNLPDNKIGSFKLVKLAEAGTSDQAGKISGIEAGGAVENGGAVDEFSFPTSSVSLGTGRIYIWRETVNLIKQRPLFGYGHDTLAYYFPQFKKDAISNLGSYSEIVTKPHNMYIDIAFSSGIVSLCVLIYLLLAHIYRTIHEHVRCTKNRFKVLPIAIFIFMCSFLIQWMFNDSIIASSVIFWVLFGVAVSLNIEAS